MTQHLTVFLCPPGHQRAGQHRTACGRWVTAANATGPAGVTCRACKATDAWREAGDWKSARGAIKQQPTGTARALRAYGREGQ